MKLSGLLSAMLLVVFGVVNSVAQTINFDDYQPLKSQGVLPVDFTDRTSEKVSEAIAEQIEDTDARRTKKSKAAFILKANYMIDNLLMSGNVLFGDPATDYVNKVADKILKNEPELRNKLRFYCVKSNVTNAFTTNQGMIFVTLGLLAQLENEAQLAFILGHEVTHYKRKHVINTVLESDKIFSKNNRTTRMSQDQNIIKLSNYSKTLELESDSTGFYYVQKAGYDMDEVLSSFDVLQFSYLPYDEIEIEIDFAEFESNGFIIPVEKKLDTLIEIDFEIDEDDSKSTHPNLNKRRDEIFNLMEEYSGVNKGVTALVSEKDFFNVRKISRYETVRIDLKNLNFVKAYYNAMVLLKENPNSSYLKKSVAKALYGISKFKFKNKYSRCADYFEEYEGAISAAYYFFGNADDLEMATLAIKYIYEANKANPNDHLQRILEDLIHETVTEIGKDFNFEKYFPFDIQEGEEGEEAENNEGEGEKTEGVGSVKELTKYEKLKKIREAQEQKEEAPVVAKKDKYNYFRFMFVGYPEREGIKSLYVKAKEQNDLKLKKEEDRVAGLSFSDNRKRVKAEQKAEKYKRKKGLGNSIAAEKMIVVDPIYYVVDERKGVKLENSEDLKYGFYEQLKTVSDAASLEIDILSPKLCKANEYDKMNHLSVCNDWIEEVRDLAEVTENFDFIPSQSEYMSQVSDTYGTDNVCFTGVVDFRLKNQALDIFGPSGFVIPIFWPFYFYEVARPRHDVYYYTFVYDSKTGKSIVDKIYYMRRRPMEGNINSYMYELFMVMKNNLNN